jgi:hypothetical protein
MSTAGHYNYSIDGDSFNTNKNYRKVYEKETSKKGSHHTDSYAIQRFQAHQNAEMHAENEERVYMKV